MSSSLLELPHNMDGEVDWDTLGKILCAKLMGEVLCASYVDKKYGIADPQITPDTEWKFLYHEDGVVALEKSYPDSPIKAFMGRGVIDLPMDSIIPYLESHEHRKDWDRFLVEIKQVREFSPVDSAIYMRCVATNCLVKQERDFLHFERMAPVDDKYVRSAVAIELPDHPPIPGIIRAEVKPGSGWLLEPYRGCTTKTLVSYLAHMDLKAVPPLIMNRIIRRQPKAIYRICKILEHQDLRKLLPSLSQGPRETSPWSEDSLSSNDRREVVRASEEYCRGNEQPYSDDLAIHDFTGDFKHYNKIERTVSVNLNPNSEKGQADKNGVNIKAAVPENQSSQPSPKSKKSGFFRGSFKRGKGSQKGKKKSQSKTEPPSDHKLDCHHRLHSAPVFDTSPQDDGKHSSDKVMMHAIPSDVSSLATSGTGLLWQTPPRSGSPDVTDSTHFEELQIDSDPHISETTGLAVDGYEGFYTPYESEEDRNDKADGTEEHVGDTEHGKEQRQPNTAWHSLPNHALDTRTDCSDSKLLVTGEVTNSPAGLDRANGYFVQAIGNSEFEDNDRNPANAAENGLCKEQYLDRNGVIEHTADHTDSSSSPSTVHMLGGGITIKDQVVPQNKVADMAGDCGQTCEASHDDDDDDNELSFSMPVLRPSDAPSSSLPQRIKRTSSEKLLVV